MIEQGLVQLVQGTPAVSAICAAGGFFAELPKGQRLPSWTYLTVSDPGNYILTGPEAGMRRVQIDCYGTIAADAMRLAGAIDSLLSGFRGTLTDPDTVFVQGCFRSNLIDFFDADGRTYRFPCQPAAGGTVPDPVR